MMIEFVEDLTPDPTLRKFRDRATFLLKRTIEQALDRDTFTRILVSMMVDARAEGLRDASGIAVKMLQHEKVGVWGGGFTDLFDIGYRQALQDIQIHLAREFAEKDGVE